LVIRGCALPRRCVAKHCRTPPQNRNQESKRSLLSFLYGTLPVCLSESLFGAGSLFLSPYKGTDGNLQPVVCNRTRDCSRLPA